MHHIASSFLSNYNKRDAYKVISNDITNVNNNFDNRTKRSIAGRKPVFNLIQTGFFTNKYITFLFFTITRFTRAGDNFIDGKIN